MGAVSRVVQANLTKSHHRGRNRCTYPGYKARKVDGPFQPALLEGETVIKQVIGILKSMWHKALFRRQLRDRYRTFSGINAKEK